MNLRNKVLQFFVHGIFTSQSPEKISLFGFITWQGPNKGASRYHDPKRAYKSGNLQLQSHSLTFLLKIKSLFSATCVLSQRPNLMSYNTTTSLDKLICTDNKDFGKRHDRFGRCSWSKDDSNCLDVKLEVFKKDNDRHFRLVQIVTIRKADFKQFMRLRNQLVVAA